MTFLDELLAETEERELQVNKLRADQLLMAIAVLEGKMDDVNTFADEEIQIIESYRSSELAKLKKKRSWLSWNLERFIRSTKEKTMKLPHGTMKLRMGRDKVEITDMEMFLKIAPKKGLLKTIPESYEPNLPKILEYIKSRNMIPDGVTHTPAKTKFSYTLLKGKEDAGENESSEAGIATERVGEAEAVEG